MKEKKIHLLLAVLATGIMSFAGVLIETAMNVTFPTMIKQFGISTGMVQWVTTIYLLVISIMVPFSNYLLKNFSIRKLFIIANLFFIAGLMTDLWSPSYSILLIGRLLQGISTGIALPLMFHIILNFTPMHKRGTMMGVGTLTTSIAPAIGPTYGGIMTASLSWHAIFLFLLPMISAFTNHWSLCHSRDTCQKNWCIRYCQSHWRCIAVQRTIDVLKSNWKLSESTFIGSWYHWLIDLLSASDTGKKSISSDHRFEK